MLSLPFCVSVPRFLLAARHNEADGIRVNGVASGYIRNAQALSEEHSLGPEWLVEEAEFIPMGKMGEPEDIADFIILLSSEGAVYISGQVLVINGGLLVDRY